ncbi:MAG: hypothetical protein Q9167_005936 [Letrouitia subvulpina]
MPDFNNSQLDGPLTTDMLQDMSASLTSSGYSELLDLETGDELRKHSMAKACPIHGYPTPDTLSLYTTFPSEEPNASYVTPPSTATSEINLNSVSRSISTESDDLFALPQLYISSSPSSSSSVHTPDLLPTCSCLEQHTELLCLLKKLEQGQTSVDSVLIGVQQALAPWQHLIQCRVCTHDGDQSVLFLAVMSIRSILRRLQRLYLANEYSSPPSGFSTPVRASQGNSIGNVTLGSYKATDNEQKHITDLLVIHALGKIKYALLSLSDKFRQSRGRISASSLPDLTDGSMSPMAGQDIDPSCLQQLLQSLETTVQALCPLVGTCKGVEQANMVKVAENRIIDLDILPEHGAGDVVAQAKKMADNPNIPPDQREKAQGILAQLQGTGASVAGTAGTAVKGVVDTAGNTVGALGEGLVGTVGGVAGGLGSTVKGAGGVVGSGIGAVEQNEGKTEVEKDVNKEEEREEREEQR